jgi:NAD/NADP transhydrogenase alpha subunit
MQGERRVAAIPDTVKKLSDGGAKVLLKRVQELVHTLPMKNTKKPVQR